MTSLMGYQEVRACQNRPNNPRVVAEGFQHLPFHNEARRDVLCELIIGRALLPYFGRAFQDDTLSNLVEVRRRTSKRVDASHCVVWR